MTARRSPRPGRGTASLCSSRSKPSGDVRRVELERGEAERGEVLALVDLDHGAGRRVHEVDGEEQVRARRVEHGDVALEPRVDRGERLERRRHRDARGPGRGAPWPRARARRGPARRASRTPRLELDAVARRRLRERFASRQRCRCWAGGWGRRCPSCRAPRPRAARVPAVGRRVGLVARAEVDAALGRRLVGAGRAAEHRALELRVLVEHLARRVGAAELGGHDALLRGLAPTRPSSLASSLVSPRLLGCPLASRI